jgi:LmbE family N-acetylglucosaminyl deacetylase
VRTGEQIASAAVVGVSTVEFLDHADGTLEYGLALRRDLAVAIRRHRPDTLLLLNHRETWGPGRLNSPDHRHIGQAALEAIGDAGNRWIFSDAGGGLPPHAGVREALVCGSPVATHAADVTEAVDLAVASLAEHRAYLQGLGDHPMADPEVLRDWLELAGRQVQGRGAVVTFELFSF